MARLSYVDKETAGPEQQRVLAQVTQKSGKIANMWKILGHSPQTLETFVTFYKTLMKGALDPKLRELAYVKASTINNCPYCAESHKVSGRRAGLTDQQILEIGNYADSTAYSPLEKLVLGYAEELTRTARSSEDVVTELRKNLSEADIVELNLTVGVANLTNRFNMSMMTDMDS
jgi:uncharacterized peroxidase-related enzyme